MTTMYDEAGPSVLVMAAGMSVDAHCDGRTCQQCGPDGCRQLTWARQTLAEYRSERRSGAGGFGLDSAAS